MITVMMKVMVMVMVMVIITVMMMVMVLARISNVLMPCYLCPSHYLQQANTHIRFLRLPITKYFALFLFSYQMMMIIIMIYKLTCLALGVPFE